MRKKLLIVTDTPTLTSGLGRICKEVALKMSDNFDVAVGGWHHMPLRTSYSFHIYPLRKGHADEGEQFQLILGDFQPDLILAIGDLWNFGYFIQALAEYKDQVKPVKTILWCTVDGEYLISGWGEIVRNFDSVASFTHYGVKELKKLEPNKNYKVIYPGLRHHTFHAYPDDYKWGKQNIIDVNKTFMILVVGQNCDRKNIPATLEAFAEFRKGKPDALLFMVTNPREAFGFDLWQITKKLQLGSSCVIVKDANPRSGISDEKLNLIYNMATCIINTSIGEGAGLPLMEAQATNCVPLATNYAAAPEVVGDRGRLIDVGEIIYGEYGMKRAVVSHKDIIRQLNYLYADWKKDKTLIKEYNKKGLEFIKNFTWDRTASELFNLIQEAQVEKKRSWVKEKVKVQVQDMKLLEVVPSWGKNCGIAEYSKELSNAIEKTGEKVYIFPNNDLQALKTFVQQEKYNVVVFQHEYIFFQDRFLLEKILSELKEINVKTIVELHSYSPLKHYNDMLIEKADEVIVHCDLFKKNIIGDRSIENVKVVNMGCKAPVKFDISNVQKNLGIDNKHPIIGSFGFMRDQKGYKEIAIAIKELSVDYPDIRFLLVAPKHEFGSEAYVDNFYKYIESLGIADRTIIVREYMENEKLLTTLACADIFVLNYKSSRAGGGNSAAIKTLMQVQRPIITSDTFYFADFTNEIYKIKSEKDIKEAIKTFYDRPEMCKQYIERANAYLLKNSWENVVKQHLDIYTG